jgi:acetyl esterase
VALDPNIQEMLNAIERSQIPPTNQMQPPQAREMLKQMFLGMEITRVPVFTFEDREIPGSAGSIQIRVYTPKGEGPHPVLVFFHGGGFVLGDLDTYDPACRRLCARSRHAVVSVDYRLAPEHKFPAAVEDCVSAKRWLAENAASINGDPEHICVAGDSAGGNLAAVVAQRARDGALEDGPALAGQVLFYPVTYQVGPDTASRKENAEGYFLTREDMAWFGGHYFESVEAASSPEASPANVDSLAGLPPALVVTAGYDPLRDEGEDYARALEEAGVPTTLTRYEDMIHGFLNFYGVTERSDEVVNEAGEWLKRIAGVGG